MANVADSSVFLSYFGFYNYIAVYIFKKNEVCICYTPATHTDKAQLKDSDTLCL